MLGILVPKTTKIWSSFFTLQSITLGCFLTFFVDSKSLFRVFRFPQVVQKHTFGEVGTWTCRLMASYVRNIRTKNYENLMIRLQVTISNVGDLLGQCRTMQKWQLARAESGRLARRCNYDCLSPGILDLVTIHSIGYCIALCTGTEQLFFSDFQTPFFLILCIKNTDYVLRDRELPTWQFSLFRKNSFTVRRRWSVTLPGHFSRPVSQTTTGRRTDKDL